MRWPDFFKFGSKDKPFFLKDLFSLFSVAPSFNNYGGDLEKLKKAFTNPALLKVISLQCDLFSLGKIYVYKGETEIESDPAVNMFNKPNPFQGRQQFLYDFMFWNMIGNAYLYIDSKVVSENNKMYWLVSDKIEWPQDFDKAKDKLFFSNASISSLDKLQLLYRYADGSSVKINWGNVLHWSDLTNGVGNWFKGNSRIEALCKVIDNSEAALDAKNINVRFSGKFMVAGTADPKNITERPLSTTDKSNIEENANSFKTVHALKSMIEIKRFVENMANLKLGEAYLEDYFIIGAEFGIPKDVLEAYNSSTFENQEKARGAHVSYCLQPKGDDLMEKISQYIGYTDKSLVISWDHLPFMQVFEKDRASTQQTKSQTLLNLQKAGVSEDDINKFLDTKFTNLKPISSDVKAPEQQQPTAGASNQSGTAQA